MRSPNPPCYRPTLPAPERGVLSVLHAVLLATECILRDEHPDLDQAPRTDQRLAPVVLAAAHLVTRRCAELRSLLDFYDAAVDEVVNISDDLADDSPSDDDCVDDIPW